ncbi:MAG: hypothetical protein JOY64_19010, partial [Alphaproteobacteria bacterium]|nr:hypothetical protein [Alphaproteobacteria bacterium]
MRTTIAGLLLGSAMTSEASAQAPSPVDIPLSLVTQAQGSTTPYQLGINVSINGGASRRYLFDTGSALFNYKVDKPGPPSPFGPSGTGVTYQYGPNGALGVVTGNLVQLQSLGFQGGVTLTPSTGPGYVANAVYDVKANQSGFENNFNGTTYWGVFGAGNFASWSPKSNTNPPQGLSAPGGILGQTMVSGVTQGYVVAANGWTTPNSSTVLPQQPNGITLSVGGQSITPCSPCVTVGLTPQMLGQFAPIGAPGNTGLAGVVPTAAATNTTLSSKNFYNPYIANGGVTGPNTGNNGSRGFGSFFTTTLTPPGGQPVPVVPPGVPTLLDTGASLLVSQSYSNTSVSDGTTINAGVQIAMTGLAGGAPVAGLPTTTAILTNASSNPPPASGTYNAGLYPPDATCSTANTCIRSGLWFYLQNSVMFDLNDNAIGYTPFFVTDASLATTANGPLIISGTNVPIGLAGVVSGPGGVTVSSGGALQLSATNSYTGPTTIAAGGQLLVSGPGSIASSSGVLNNGVFDITRAWQAESIQALTGSGQVFLGSQNLTITNASGTFPGTSADNGSYPGPGVSITYPGTGGSVTILGGTQTLSGVNTYTGG